MTIASPAARAKRNLPRGTPAHTVRVPDEVWTAAQRIAESQGGGMAAVVRTLLVGYVAAHTDGGRS